MIHLGSPRKWPRGLSMILVIGAVASASAAAPSPVGPSGSPLFVDDGAREDTASLWGRVDCADAERQSRVLLGGEPSSDLDDGLIGTTAFRRLTVFDEDNRFGERCELGLNDWKRGPTALFHGGQRRITTVALRLPQSFPLETRDWQTVVQMKQSQPSDGGGGSPVIELRAYDGAWRLNVATRRTVGDWMRWSAPAVRGRWTKFTFDVVYSMHPRIGSVRLRVDLNGDGDTNDSAERSGPFHGTTLKRETAERGFDDGLRRGAAIPSHLRVGIYHNPRIRCPSGCSADVDSVRITSP